MLSVKRDNLHQSCSPSFASEADQAWQIHFRKNRMNINPLQNRRILLIDDNPAIHQDFRKVLIRASLVPNDLDEQESGTVRTYDG